MRKYFTEMTLGGGDLEISPDWLVDKGDTTLLGSGECHVEQVGEGKILIGGRRFRIVAVVSEHQQAGFEVLEHEHGSQHEFARDWVTQFFAQPAPRAGFVIAREEATASERCLAKGLSTTIFSDASSSNSSCSANSLDWSSCRSRAIRYRLRDV